MVTWLPILVGFTLFGVLTALAVVVGRILPKWMGWVMFAFGLACLAGPVGFFGLLATMLWVLVAGIWMDALITCRCCHNAADRGHLLPL